MRGRHQGWAMVLGAAIAAIAGCSAAAPGPAAASGAPDRPAETADNGAPVSGAAADSATASAGAAEATAAETVAAGGVSATGARMGADAGAGTCWDWLPIVGYDNEALVIALRVGADAGQWHAHRIYKDGWGGEMPLTVGDGAVTLNVFPGQTPDADTLEFTGPHGDVRVRLVRPGAGRGLARDGLGHLTIATADGAEIPAILVLPRLEAEADRRWQTLRWLGGEPTFQCTLSEAAPVVPPGQSDLLALIAASQADSPGGRNVLVQLGGGDRLVGWNHRNYRQCLAWLVADLVARSAGHLVIAGPLAPNPDAERVAPLRAQVDDVAAAYRCQVVQLGELADASYWQVAPGILGPNLNASGQAEVQRRLAPWLSPH